MPNKRDYTKYSFRLTILVIAILLVIGFIPPFSIGNVHFRRANILSDIFTFNDAPSGKSDRLRDEDAQFLEEADKIDRSAFEKPARDEAPSDQTWDVATGVADAAAKGGTDPDEGNIDPRTVVRFIDHTPEDRVSVADFSRMMERKSKERVVRIAFLGDSFIEGDIVTADIREQLQNLYGGHGVGYVPMGHPLAISRPSVTHTFDGYTNYNIIYKKNVPEEYKGKFFVSGILSVPSEGGAWAMYKGVKFRKNLSSWSRARLLFASTGHTTIDVSVNDSIKRRFSPGAGDLVQQIVLAGNGMKSLRIEVKDPEGFIGYGVVLEDPRGVSVDNYAIRSNSGLAMFGSDAKTNARIGQLLGYDLIVLQWGLNAMDSEVVNYANYGRQLRRVINYMKSCFPHSAIVVMGVGDKAMQKDGSFVTMPAVAAMIAEQKAAARDCEVAFWDTFAAMGGENSMAAFVEKNWAAKDYTHLSYGGGRYIASQFVRALRYEGAGRGASDDTDKVFGGNAEDAGGAIPIDTARPTEEMQAPGEAGQTMPETGHTPPPDSLRGRANVPGRDSLRSDSLRNDSLRSDSPRNDSLRSDSPRNDPPGRDSLRTDS